MYNLILRHSDGGKSILEYNEENHEMTQAGRRLSLDAAELPACKDARWQCSEKLSVRISLGKRCNFHCAYCHQEKWRDRARKRLPEDAEKKDLARLVHALVKLAQEHGGIGDIQFWGGEALMYFEEIRYLHAELSKALGPETLFFLATNGALMHGERFRWVMEHDIRVSLSWDGKGQFLRGEDILRSPKTAANIRALFARDPEKTSLAPVITSKSGSMKEICAEAKTILGVEELRLTDASLVVVVDEASRNVAVPASDLPAYSRCLHKDLLSGNLPEAQWAYTEALVFLRDLNVRSFPVGATRCFAASPKTLTVDMHGNILTCQNFSASSVDEEGEKHLLGTIFSSRPKKSPDLHRLKERQTGRCRHCVVRQICKGGCPYWSKTYLDYNCKAYHAQTFPLLGLALHMLTGGVLAEVVRTH